MIDQTLPAILGGEPLSRDPLGIVRPRFPELDQFADRFRAALRSGAVTNHGPYVREFEARLAAYLDLPGVVVCNNGQSALMVMLRAAGVDSGEVVVPSYTFSATPHAVRWCGAEPVFADVDPNTLCLDPRDAERRITPRTRAILAVDAYGIACDYDALAALGRQHGIRVLYDSAPAFGTRVAGRPIGSHGDGQMFSFHATKAFATMEGGCIASRDLALLERAAALRNFGQTGGADCDEAGLNAKMPEVCALIGLEQLDGFDAVVRHRARVAERYRAGLAELPGLSFATAPANQVPVWLYFPVVVDSALFGLDRDMLALALERENLYVRKYFELPCHHLAAYAKQRRVVLPHAERVAYNVVSLPVYNDMADEESDRFTAAFRRIHAHAKEICAAHSAS